jgi:hypothetical protein
MARAVLCKPASLGSANIWQTAGQQATSFHVVYFKAAIFAILQLFDLPRLLLTQIL